jgi:hypothetical protein
MVFALVRFGQSPFNREQSLKSNAVRQINFTGVVVSSNEIARSGSNYLPPDVAENLTPAQHDNAVHGSVMTFVLEIFTLTATWTVKACLLFLYARLT